MSRHDRILLICLCILAVVVWVVQGIFLSESGDFKMLILKVSAPQATELNDVSWTELTLAGEEKTWQVQGVDGLLKVHYAPNQGIAIVESPCPDQICVQTGYINKARQSVVCVPNQVILELSLQEKTLGEGDIDAILR